MSLQSEAEQVTDVPVTGLISKTNEHGRVDLRPDPAKENTGILIHTSRWSKECDMPETGGLDNTEITEHIHKAVFEQRAPEAAVMISESIVKRVTATNDGDS